MAEGSIFVKELPENCTECGQPNSNSSWTSKAGDFWNSVRCDNCGIKWIQSKPKGTYTPKKLIPTAPGVGSEIIVEKLNQILAGQEIIKKAMGIKNPNDSIEQDKNIY